MSSKPVVKIAPSILSADFARLGEQVAETCRAMGMTITQDAADILLVQATPGGHAARTVRERRGMDLTSVVLAGLRARRDLAQALEAGARSWVTMPLTPQQLTAALSRASRGESGAWDAETCLPVINLDGLDRPVVSCLPSPGTDLFELAWLLKRFSRGYDDLCWHNGSVLIVPRAPTDHVANVAERLAVLVDGRCSFSVLAPHQIPASARFEAAG